MALSITSFGILFVLAHLIKLANSVFNLGSFSGFLAAKKDLTFKINKQIGFNKFSVYE